MLSVNVRRASFFVKALSKLSQKVENLNLVIRITSYRQRAVPSLSLSKLAKMKKKDDFVVHSSGVCCCFSLCVILLIGISSVLDFLFKFG